MKICIIGLDYFGTHLALDLAHARTEVIAIDIDPDKVEAIKDEVSHAAILDVSQAEALARLPLDEMDAVVVAIGEEFRVSLLAVGHLQEQGVKRIIARVIDPVHERLLRLMKVKELIRPDAESAQRTAQALIRGVMNSIDLTGGFTIVECKVPAAAIDKTVDDVGLRSNFELNLVTVRKPASPDEAIVSRESNIDLIGVPPTDYRFEADDVLVLFGELKHIDRFLRG